MSEVVIKRKGRGVRKTSTITTSDGILEPGMLFTIDGCGIGLRGQEVVGGRSVDSGRRAKVKTLTMFKGQKT